MAATDDQKRLLMAKEPESWNLEDVSNWLSLLGLQEYRIPFVENSVAGPELFDLDEKDLVSLGVTKLGHKKRILRSIKRLRKRLDPFDEGSEKSSEKSSDKSSETGSASESGIPRKFKVKATYKEDTRVFDAEDVESVDDLRMRVNQMFKADFNMKYQDEDGDLITIGSNQELAAAIKDGQLRLVLQPLGFLDPAEERKYSEMTDGVLIIDKKGHVQFMNRAAEEIFGYDAADCLDQNVTMLMNRHDAKHHRGYLKNYLKTGQAKIVGKTGRMVSGKRKDGSSVAVRLSVTERKDAVRHMFIGVLHETDEAGAAKRRADQRAANLAADSTLSQFQMLNMLLDPTVVINETGVVQFFNTASEKMWGLTSAEIVGRNVKQLMPEPFRSEHDAYLANFKRSGVAKVIGSGRDIAVQLRDGSIQPMHLKLNQTVIDGRKYFTGSFGEPKTTGEAKSVLEVERDVIKGLLLPAVIIDQRGIIQAWNAAAEALFQYKLSEVVGKNIKMLMNEDDAVNHDNYLARYIKTGEAKIIGKGRKVVIRKKGGEAEELKLFVTEKKGAGKRYFSGIFQAEN